MRGPDVVSVAELLAGASPREAHDMVIGRPWLLDSATDASLGDMLTWARRRGDGSTADRLERARSRLQRCREFGVDRVLVRDLLDGLAAFTPLELAETLCIVPAIELQEELRRRIDGSLDVGDPVAWAHWVAVSIALDLHGGDPSRVGTPALARTVDEVDPDARWAAQFLEAHDLEAQNAILGRQPLPLAQAQLDQLRDLVGLQVKIAAYERDAVEVIHLRRSLMLAHVAAGIGSEPELVEEVLAGRLNPGIVEGYVL